MKKLQQLIVACVFTLALTTATFAGDIATGGRSEPPPPPPTSVSTTTSGVISTATKDEGDYEYHLMEDIALKLLSAMLSVF